MQRKIATFLLGASLLTSTAGAFAQTYDRFGRPIYPQPRWYGAYGAYNGANHPTPSSTQGDVGPRGNNNGTLTGYYGGFPYGPAQPRWYGAFGAYVPSAAFVPSGAYGPYGGFWNGTNHPTPSSTQGDVGPMGNNNGTLTGYYAGW